MFVTLTFMYGFDIEYLPYNILNDLLIEYHHNRIIYLATTKTVLL